MPKRLTTQQVKDLFADYGYIVPNDFVYQNNKQPIRVYDELNRVYETLTLQKLKVLTLVKRMISLVVWLLCLATVVV